MACNAFKLSAYSDPAYPQYSQRSTRHGDFQRRLAIALMQRCEQRRTVRYLNPKRRQRTTLVEEVNEAVESYHTHVSGFKNNRCKACMAAGRSHKLQRPKRKALGELSNTHWIRNQATGSLEKEHKLDAARTVYGCLICNINLCRNARCWNEHLEAVRLKSWQQLQASQINEQSDLEDTEDLLDRWEYSSELGNEVLEDIEPDIVYGVEDSEGLEGSSSATTSFSSCYYNSDAAATTH
jgi:hypothetical protein